MSESQIAALLHEVERHEIAGRDDKVAALKAELAALGHVVSGESPVRTTSAARAKKS